MAYEMMMLWHQVEQTAARRLRKVLEAVTDSQPQEEKLIVDLEEQNGLSWAEY
jgi:hypothetical protein